MEAFFFKFMIAAFVLVILANLNFPKGQNLVYNENKRWKKSSEKSRRKNPDSSPSFISTLVLLFIAMVAISYFFGPNKN